MKKGKGLKVLVGGQELLLLAPVMKLEKQTGEHTRVSLTGMLDLEDRAQEPPVFPEMEAQILYGDSGETLFCGVVKAVSVSVETAGADPLKRIELELISETYLLDQKRRSRAFQNTDMEYQSAAQLFLKEYKNSDIMLRSGLDGLPLGSPVIQYQETDWSFLKRLMSRLNQPILPCSHLRGPKCYVGLTEGADRYEILPEEEHQVREMHCMEPEGGERHLEYQWTSEKDGLKVMDVGDIICYKGAVYYIKAAEIQVQNSSIHHQYRFCLKNGFGIQEEHNQNLTGLSLPGTVSKVSGDRMQVKLRIDAVEERNCWYPYATFHSNFYCMPEVGDRVHLYLPGNGEEQAFVLHSIREQTEGDGEKDRSVCQENALSRGESTAPEKEAGEEEAWDLLPWLKKLSGVPGGTFVGIGVETSELEEEASAREGEGGSSGEGEESSSERGVHTQAPVFDFRQLHGSEKVKVLSTKDGKMIILDDNRGSVSIRYSNGTFIILQGEGVQIHSEGYLSLSASGRIHLTAEEAMVIKADERVEIGCNGSQFTLTPEGVEIKGMDLKMNE